MKKTVLCCVIVAIALMLGQAGLAKEKPAAQDWLNQGIALQQKGVHGEAIKSFTEAINLDPRLAEAYFNRGRSYRADRPTFASEAMRDFDRTIDLEPENAEAYYERGLLNAFIIDNENARSDMQTAANLGHEKAKKWLLPEPQPQAKAPEAAPVPVAAAAEAPAAPAVPEEKAELPSFPIGEYLASRREPVVHFDLDKSDIKKRDMPLLDEIGTLFKEKLPEAAIVLAGHTDSSGDEGYNDGLSLQRAKAVEAYLRDKYEFAEGRFIVKGFGESSPVASNATKKGQAKNRRVEIMGAGRR
jgi:OOP family OmpA-OmpF porin